MSEILVKSKIKTKEVGKVRSLFSPRLKKYKGKTGVVVDIYHGEMSGNLFYLVAFENNQTESFLAKEICKA